MADRKRALGLPFRCVEAPSAGRPLKGQDFFPRLPDGELFRIQCILRLSFFLDPGPPLLVVLRGVRSAFLILEVFGDPSRTPTLFSLVCPPPVGPLQFLVFFLASRSSLLATPEVCHHFFLEISLRTLVSLSFI